VTFKRKGQYIISITLLLAPLGGGCGGARDGFDGGVAIGQRARQGDVNGPQERTARPVRDNVENSLNEPLVGVVVLVEVRKIPFDIYVGTVTAKQSGKGILDGVMRAVAGSAFHAGEGVLQRAADQRLATNILAILSDQLTSGVGRGLLASEPHTKGLREVGGVKHARSGQASHGPKSASTLPSSGKHDGSPV
jgi:hypothetical protein